MATKKCVNGHMYDSAIYGDNCPFCPKPTVVVGGGASALGNDEHTINIPPVGVDPDPEPGTGGGGHTVIRRVGGGLGDQQPVEGKKLVGMLVSYDTKATGEVFPLYEGKNFIGSSERANVRVTNDYNVSGEHLLILYRPQDKFTAADQSSTNGTFINGEFQEDKCKLKDHDVIVIGGTKFTFFAVPEML